MLTRARAVMLALVAALACAPAAGASTWLESGYFTGDVDHDNIDIAMDGLLAPAPTREWRAPDAPCPKPRFADACAIDNWGGYVWTVGIDSGDGDDIVSVSGPAQHPWSTPYELGNPGSAYAYMGRGSDMLTSRIELGQSTGVNSAISGGPGRDMLDARNFEGDEIDCGQGEDTVYLDPPAVVEFQRYEGHRECEHVIVGDDPIGEVRIEVGVPANRLTHETELVTTALEVTAAGGGPAPAGTFECRSQRGRWEPCAVGDTIRQEGDGAHGRFARFVAADGTIASRIGVTGWQLDTIPPSDPVLHRRSATGALGTVERFDFASLDPGQGYECAVGDGAFAPCESPFELPADAPGAYRFAVRAYDTAGNRSAIASSEWAVARVFAAPPLIPRAPAASPAPPAVASATLGSAVARGRGVALQVRCGAPRRCRGTVTLRYGGRSVGRARVDVPAGARRTVQVPLRASARARLRARGTLRVTARLRLSGGTPTARTIVLKRL